MACHGLTSDSSTLLTSLGLCAADPAIYLWPGDDRGCLRRACAFRLSPSRTIKAMTPELLSDSPRVGVLIRVHLSVRDGLRDRVAAEDMSMNRYLERLIDRDLSGPETAGFIALETPTFASRGKNGEGRPTKGERAAILIRIAPHLREQLHQRAAFLHLTVNDYLESLVSQDISAASGPAGEEMTFDRTA